MSTFEQQRRQQFIYEDYYIKLLNKINNSICLYLDEFDAEDTVLESGEALKWFGLSGYVKNLFYLKYTAGEAIETMLEPFVQFLEYKDKEAVAEAVHKKTYRDNVLGNIEDSLPIVALAYLLDRRDLLPLIKLLIDGERDKLGNRSMIDAILARFFRVNDPSQPVQRYDEDYALYSTSHRELCKVLDEAGTVGNKDRAIAALDDYLSNWYANQELQTWYNSHTRMENEVGYVGYWAFEAAAMVYFLDLDDSSLHKYLYYPKDIVAWIRQKHPITQDTKKEVFETIVLQENEIAQSTGYYQDPMTKRVVYLKQGDIAPAYPSDTDVTYARSYLWYKLTDYGVSLIPTETLNQLKK